MLQRNGSQNITIGYATGGAIGWQNKFIIKEEELFNIVSIDPYASYPQGDGMKAFMLPMKAGAISGRIDINAYTTASGSMGINIEGTVSVSIDSNTPAMGLIVSGTGSSFVTLTSDASAIATLNGTGTASFTIGLNHLAMYVDADGYASASLGVVGNAYGTLSAIGVMSGDTVDSVALTPAAIWSYDLRTLSVNVATKGDVYAASFL